MYQNISIYKEFHKSYTILMSMFFHLKLKSLSCILSSMRSRVQIITFNLEQFLRYKEVRMNSFYTNEMMYGYLLDYTQLSISCLSQKIKMVWNMIWKIETNLICCLVHHRSNITFWHTVKSTYSCRLHEHLQHKM